MDGKASSTLSKKADGETSEHPDINMTDRYESGTKQQSLEQLSDLVTAVMPLAKEYVDLQKSKFDFSVKRDERAGSHNRKLTSYLLVFLGIVIGITAVLTYLGKVSGDALLFMVGIVVGYLMNMIQGLLYSQWEGDQNED